MTWKIIELCQLLPNLQIGGSSPKWRKEDTKSLDWYRNCAHLFAFFKKKLSF